MQQCCNVLWVPTTVLLLCLFTATEGISKSVLSLFTCTFTAFADLYVTTDLFPYVIVAPVKSSVKMN